MVRLDKSEPVGNIPPEAQVSFLLADGEGALRVRLPAQLGVDEALFMVRVSNESASEEITMLVTREQFPRVCLKVLLGGAAQ